VSGEVHPLSRLAGLDDEEAAAILEAVLAGQADRVQRDARMSGPQAVLASLAGHCPSCGCSGPRPGLAYAEIVRRLR
jgi:hypothetical protein